MLNGPGTKAAVLGTVRGPDFGEPAGYQQSLRSRAISGRIVSSAILGAAICWPNTPYFYRAMAARSDSAPSVGAARPFIVREIDVLTYSKRCYIIITLGGVLCVWFQCKVLSGYLREVFLLTFVLSSTYLSRYWVCWNKELLWKDLPSENLISHIVFRFHHHIYCIFCILIRLKSWNYWDKPYIRLIQCSPTTRVEVQSILWAELVVTY